MRPPLAASGQQARPSWNSPPQQRQYDRAVELTVAEQEALQELAASRYRWNDG